jgi:hypothetical protein
MKAARIVVLIFLLCAHTAAFANDNRLSLGFEYGNFFEKRTDGGVALETYRGAPGLDFCVYHLWDTFGFFQNHSFLFPNNIVSNRDGYDYFFQYNFIMGPAFRIPFTKTVDMTLGLGLSFGPITGEFNNRPLTQFNVGIGGDVGVSFFVNKMIYVNTGSLVSYIFANTTSTGTGQYDDEGDEITETEWSRNYNMAGVRPYIRIGMLVN